MIPKVIHYCWFGGNALGEKEKACIQSWKKFCPDFQIIEWNESNCDLQINEFVKQASERNAYAFLSDYFRIKVVNEQGGIYLDTDVELIKPLDDLLCNELYMGIEKNEESDIHAVASGLGFGSVKNHPVLDKLLQVYDKLTFVDENGVEKKVACPQLETEVLKEFGFEERKNQLQRFNGITVYPSEYFAPKSYIKGDITITDNTYSVHHYSMNWMDKDRQALKTREWELIKKFGYEKAKSKIKRVRFCYKIKKKIKKVFTGK